MTSDSIKFCKDCRWMQRSRFLGFLWEMKVPSYRALCEYPAISNLVTGTSEWRCEYARGAPPLCDKEGKYWEPRSDTERTMFWLKK